ncbi:unnamed protein product [Paramecium primaurelia]|uniref:Transmembrane protein n=1 Tax=Paramecium primaurelia TaxID=5886 RepID=A0A8S1NDR0_PARPR|nr:unnamed protein product [Paramecium primaurelia]
MNNNKLNNSFPENLCNKRQNCKIRYFNGNLKNQKKLPEILKKSNQKKGSVLRQSKNRLMSQGNFFSILIIILEIIQNIQNHQEMCNYMVVMMINISIQMNYLTPFYFQKRIQIKINL